MGSTPSTEELNVFLQSIYGECKIYPTPQERKVIQSTLEHANAELIKGDINFVEKPKWPGLVFPQLRELTKTEAEKNLDELVDKEGSSDKFKDAYKNDLIKKAELALYKLNHAGQKHKALMLKNDLDTYRTVSREYGEGSRARVQHQIALENRLATL